MGNSSGNPDLESRRPGPKSTQDSQLWPVFPNCSAPIVLRSCEKSVSTSHNGLLSVEDFGKNLAFILMPKCQLSALENVTLGVYRDGEICAISNWT